MTLDQLRYLVAVNRTKHIGKAGRMLAISPSAISHALNGLAEELKVPILVKIGRNITLSPQAELLVQNATSILAQVDSLTTMMQNSDAEIKGSAIMCATHGLPASVLAGVLAKLQRSHPALRLELASKPSLEVLRDVQNSLVELGLCFNPQKHSEISMEPILKQRLVVAVRGDHRDLQNSRAKKLKLLSELPCAMPMTKFGIENCQQHPALLAAGVKLNIAMQFDDYNAGVAFLTSSDAWSFVPEFYLQPNMKMGGRSLVEFVKLDQLALAEVNAVWNKKKGLNAIGSLVLEALRQSAKPHITK